MIPLEEARAIVLDGCPAPTGPGAAVDSIHDALGCVLAVDVHAAEDVPPFDNSAMDGFAVRDADIAGASPERPVRLRVATTTAAGDAPAPPIEAGTAVRIMTGAPVPPGTDAVIPVEASTPVDGPGDHVDLLEAPTSHRHIRPAGDDVRRGDLVVPSGTVLSPAHLGVLASLNHRRAIVHRRPVVTVISTGDELVEHDGPLEPGQIRESNRPTLVTALRTWGFDARDGGTLPDDPDRLSTALLELAGTCDAIVTSGGVSMGDFDVVKIVLAEIADMAWVQIAIRPAKPFAFGRIGTTPVFGLPGNPVSSFVSAALLAVPGLRSLAARTDLDLPRVLATAAVDIRRRPDPRTTYARVDCRWDGDGLSIRPVSAQGSHQLAATANANGLAVLPPGDGYTAGERIETVLLRDPFGP